MTRFSTQSIKSAQVDGLVARRFIKALSAGRCGTGFAARRRQRIEVLLDALASFPELRSSEGIGYYGLQPFDSLVALGAVLKYAYRQLAAMCAVDPRVVARLARSVAGKRLLARIKEDCRPSPLRTPTHRVRRGKLKACKAADRVIDQGCELLEHDSAEPPENAPVSHESDPTQ